MNRKTLRSHSVIKEIYGHDLYEYLLVACPDQKTEEKIKAEKQRFYTEYKIPVLAETKPHIVVSGFFAKEAMEETLIRWIQRICRQYQSFALTLNNYSGIPQHTIYLRVQNEHPFQKLFAGLQELNSYFSSCACPPMQFISSPHVTIATKLSEEIYSKALIRYAHQSFHESFEVNELQLLKRKREYEECKAVNIFGLQPAENACAV